MNIEQKRKELHAVLFRANKLRTEIEEIENAVELPALRKKYNNTYWIYDNGYNNVDRWPLYYHCIKVTSTSAAKTVCFQSMSGGKFECEINKHTYFSSFQKQITKKEYLTALRKFLKSTEILKP